jgi:uncharacterized coiled-coil protein SlyX
MPSSTVHNRRAHRVSLTYDGGFISLTLPCIGGQGAALSSVSLDGGDVSARTSRRRGVAVEEDSFEDLYLEDFIGANRRVARHLVQDMNITDRQEEFLNRGLQAGLDVEEDQHLVLELAVGYAATGTVMAIEEVALTNQRLMSLEERVTDQEREVAALTEALRHERERVDELEEAVMRLTGRREASVAVPADDDDGVLPYRRDVRRDLCRVSTLENDQARLVNLQAADRREFRDRYNALALDPIPEGRAEGSGGVGMPEGEGWGVGDYRLVPIGELTRSPASSEGRGVVVSDAESEAGSDESMEV